MQAYHNAKKRMKFGYYEGQSRPKFLDVMDIILNCGFEMVVVVQSREWPFLLQEGAM